MIRGVLSTCFMKFYCFIRYKFSLFLWSAKNSSASLSGFYDPRWKVPGLS